VIAGRLGHCPEEQRRAGMNNLGGPHSATLGFKRNGSEADWIWVARGIAVYSFSEFSFMTRLFKSSIYFLFLFPNVTVLRGDMISLTGLTRITGGETEWKSRRVITDDISEMENCQIKF
jgi:hypothetical protein